jgi:YVTN family beta-propeller protein
MNKYVRVIQVLLSLMLSAELMAAPLMYVPMGNSNDLIIIDLSTDRIIGRIDELENAHGLAASPNSEYLVAGSMQPFESGDERVIVKPQSVSEDEHAAHHAGGDEIKTTPSFLSIVHPKHGHVMRRIAVRGLSHHTAVSPDGHYAVAVHSGAGGISIIDLNKMEVVNTIQTGQMPNYALFSHNGQRLYVTNAGSGTVSEIDTGNWAIKRELKVGKEPEHMVLSVDDSTLFVANVADGTAVAVNLDNGAIQKTFIIGKEPHGIDITPDGRWLFVSSRGDQKLIRIDLTDNSTLIISLQPAPYHVAYVGEVGKLYVSSRKEPKIWVLDPLTLKVSTVIDAGRGVAHQMVVLPK